MMFLLSVALTLTLSGAPRVPLTVSVNKVGLLWERITTADRNTCTDDVVPCPKGTKDTRASLARAAADGFNVIRFAASGFWPHDLMLFVNETTRPSYLAALDSVFADARHLGVRLIPSLQWNHWAFVDICNETLRDMMRNSTSCSSRATNMFVTTVVKRYATAYADVVYAWELGNELDLLVDLDHTNSTTNCAPVLGTPATRSAKDNFTTVDMVSYQSEIAGWIRTAAGETDVLISSGHAVPRPAAHHLALSYHAAARDWTKDTEEELVQVLDLFHTDLDLICVHIYPGDPLCVETPTLHQCESYRFGHGPTYLLSVVAKAAAMAKPKQKFVYLGEFGTPLPDRHNASSPLYNFTMDMLDAAKKLNAPGTLATYWSWEDDHQVNTWGIFPPNATDKNDARTIAALQHYNVQQQGPVTFDFHTSAFPWGTGFTGTTPLPDKAGASCGEELATSSLLNSKCAFMANDTFLAETLPGWTPAPGAPMTRPWANGFSAPRLLGGLATHNATDGTYTPNLAFEVVTRDPADPSRLVYNWSRIDATLVGFLHGALTERFVLVLDNVPFAFVAPENRYYVSYGNAAAPDDPLEFARFVGDLAAHLVGRYGLPTVETSIRFRLGTECDGPRFGPRWINYTAPNPPFVAPNGLGGNFTTRDNGFDKYVATYLAVDQALQKVAPGAGFGPSNMAGISGGAGGGGPGEQCDSCLYLNAFADRVKGANARLDFIAASEYSKWDAHGMAPAASMADTPTVLARVAARAGHPAAPVEIHEWGWAGWGQWSEKWGKFQWPEGTWGGAWGLGSMLYQRRGGVSRLMHWGYQLDNSLNGCVAGRCGNASNTCLPGTTYCSAKELRAGCVPTCRPFGYPLVTAHGWLLSALQAVSAGGAALSEAVADLAAPGDRSYNHTVGAVKGAATGGISLLALHYTPNATERFVRRFRVELSAVEVRQLRPGGGDGGNSGGCAGLAVTQQVLNSTTSVHDLIEEQLFQAGHKVAAEKRAVDAVGNMATDDGLRAAVAAAPRWMALNRQSLRASAFEGTLSNVGGGGGCVLEFNMEAPSMQLLRITPKTKTSAASSPAQSSP